MRTVFCSLRSSFALSLGIASAIATLAGCATPRRDGEWTRQYQDDFSGTLAAHWVIEQQPGGTVRTSDGALVIDDARGCTVWFRPKLQAPVRIRYTVTMSSQSRVSDMNCFWMASDPRQPDLFAPGHTRDGTFGSYDSLRTYYVGYGGNANTTTRFRRYDGTGARPLLPGHDRGEPPFLLRPDQRYTIELLAEGTRVQYRRDGEVIFDVTDSEPLSSGWFGFRTIHSRMIVDEFEVWTKRSSP
jgi:hypothetical protein